MQEQQSRTKEIALNSEWLESVPDGLIVSDHTGRITQVNSAAQRMFGYAKGELIGAPVEILVPEDLRATHRKRRNSYMASPEVRPMRSDLQFSARRKNGSLFAAEISLGPVKTDEGRYFVSAVRDITARNRIREKLETNHLIQSTVASILRVSLEAGSLEEISRKILDELLSVSWLDLRPIGSIFLVDQTIEDRLRLAAAAGLPGDRIAFPDEIALAESACASAAASGEIVFTNGFGAERDRLHPADSTDGHFCVPVLSSRRLLGIVNLYVDARHESNSEEKNFLRAIADVLAGVIERKLAEEKLRKSEERFELAVRGTDAGIWDWDLSTDKVYFSPRWKSMLGYTDSEIESDFAEWRRRLHPDDQERALATLREYLDGRVSDYELEHRLRHKDGTYRWILARGASVFDSGGKAHRMVGSHIDITDHKRAEDSLREREAQLLAAQWIQKQFLPKAPPELDGFDIAGSIYPADFAAGDLYDYIPLADGAAGLVIGDVAGHGIGSALVMASTHAYLHSFAAVHSDVNEVLAQTNAALVKETDPDMFVTTFFGRLDPDGRLFTYASAGHPPGYILDRRGRVKTTLERTSMPLAIADTYKNRPAERIELERGDLLFLLTDGVVEARSLSGEFFGVDKALQVVQANRHRKSNQIVADLYDALIGFTGTDHPSDDVTIMILKVEE